MGIPLRTENLTKVYRINGKNTRTALDRLSIDVPEHTIFGFLGPNGAGKTTTIKLILDFLRPTSGNIEVFGKPTSDHQSRSLIGYLPEQPYFHKFLTPGEICSVHAVLAGVDRKSIKRRVNECLERVGIADRADTSIAKLSKGLAQRVGLAQALVGNPKLLILDEPTSGLDPIARCLVRDLLLELKNQGTTIFLSSHQLSEIENICDRVAVLKQGKLQAAGTPAAITKEASEVIVRAKAIDNAVAQQLRFLDIVTENGDGHTLLRLDKKNIYAVMQALEHHGIEILEIETRTESLEEAFLRLAA